MKLVEIFGIKTDVFCCWSAFYRPFWTRFFWKKHIPQEIVERLRYVISNDEMKVRRKTPLNPWNSKGFLLKKKSPTNLISIGFRSALFPPPRPAEWRGDELHAWWGDGRLNYVEFLRALYVRAGHGARALLEVGAISLKQFGSWLLTILPKRFEFFFLIWKFWSLKGTCGEIWDGKRCKKSDKSTPQGFSSFFSWFLGLVLWRFWEIYGPLELVPPTMIPPPNPEKPGICGPDGRIRWRQCIGCCTLNLPGVWGGVFWGRSSGPGEWQTMLEEQVIPGDAIHGWNPVPVDRSHASDSWSKVLIHPSWCIIFSLWFF